MDEYITPKKAREALQVTNKTLRIWSKENKIHSIRTPSNHRRYNLKDIQNILSCNIVTTQKQKICYCRVSSVKQMDDLERQKNYFKHKFPNHKLVTDVGSGINWKRKGLQTILEQTMQGHISELVVAHRDRLCRFAFELIEYIFKHNGVKLLVLDNENNKSTDNELTDDILSIIHIYSCRKMGRRRYSNKKNKTISNKQTKNNIKEMDGDKKICL